MSPEGLVAQAQSFVHGSACTLVLPSVLVAASVLLLAYRGVTEEEHHLPLNGFLANIMLQMFPLLALKAKIYSCTDRVSLVPMVLVKTLLMHATIGVARVVSTVADPHSETIFGLPMLVDVVLLASALGLLKWEFGFTLSPVKWWSHVDVRNLVVLSVACSVLIEAYFVVLPHSWLSAKMQFYKQRLDVSKILFTTANYIDIVAFMPVVWRLYQAEDEHEDYNIGTHVSTDAKRQVRLFFAFVVAFYMWDDVVDPILTIMDEPVAMMAHAAHFMLLLDFAGFFTFQVAQPTSGGIKQSGEEVLGLLAQTDDDDNC
uniref:Uncharacterized protein n=1 Tax=Zooxanthella nutricula TaxID=1333877 RepID=A0A7S2KB27_9DINO